METRMLPMGVQAVEEAAALLSVGEVVGIPTETVYGLAASALDNNAVQRIFAAKGRPQDNPLIAHIADMQMLAMVARELSPEAQKLAAAFWPGPLTLVLPRGGAVADAVCAGLDTVAVRMPAHSAARQIIQRAGVPLAAPSANLSGSPSPTTAQHVLDDMRGRIPLIVDGGPCEVGVESTVVSMIGKPVLLRPGAVTAKQLEEVLQMPVVIADAVVKPVEEGQRVASPGMKYRHYAPKALLTLVEGSRDAFCAYVAARAQEGVYALCFEEDGQMTGVPAVLYGHAGRPDEQAKALFEALRKLDDVGAKVVYAHAPAHDGLGLAVYNRLLRAAAFRVVQV